MRKKFRAEITGSLFIPSEKAHREIYGNGLKYGIDISRNIWGKMELHLDCKYYSNKGHLTFTQETTKLKIIPLGISLHYIFIKKKFNLYGGGGLSYLSYEEKNPIGKVKDTKVGFMIRLGGFTRLKAFKKFIKVVVVDVYLNYHYCKMKPSRVEFDAGGVDLGIGIGTECFGSAKFGQMSAFLKLQIICNNLKRGEMHDNQEKAQSLT